MNPKTFRRPVLLRLLAGALVVTGVSAVSANGQQNAGTSMANGPIASREPYTLPFKTRDEWLAFIRGTPDGRAAASAYAQLFPAAVFDRYRDGVTTRATRITYWSEGLLIRGIMVEPRAPGPHPVIIFNHGGVMKWGRIILPEILEFNRLAERGYIVLASTYRGEGGSEGQPSMDGGDVTDSLALLRIVDSLPNADPKRIGMWGFSRGGFVTYGALKRTDRLAAAVIIGGPTDLVHAPRRAEFHRFIYPHVIRDYARDKEGALARLSPIRWPEKLAARTPILLLHGGDDPRVAPADALAMASALQNLKRSYRLKLFEGGSHDLFENYAEVRQEMDRWFDAYLRDRKAAPANGIAVLPVEETEAE